MKHTRDPNRVYLFDTTNRDGEQATEGARFGIESKLETAHALAKANIDRIEAGYPSSSPADFEAVQKIAREVHGPMIFGLSHVPVEGKENDNGIEAISSTYNAVKDADYRGIHLFSIMFDSFSLVKYGYTRVQVVEGAVRGVVHARKLLGSNGQVEFSFQNATNCPLESIINGYRRMVDAGANVINVPDTIGYSHPEEITEVISTLRKELPKDVMISIHCHNDLGLAVANSLAAVKAGADIIEGTINGIGERAGNASIEEVVMNIATRKDKFNGRTVGIKTKMLNPLSKLVSYHYDMPVQQNKAIVGDNAFRHRSGIHQDGMVKGDLYEIIKPKQVGWDGESFDLTARSGYAGVALRLRRLGYDTSDKTLKKKVMPGFKTLADGKGKIGDADLVCLMDCINKTGKDKYSFTDMAIKKDYGSSYSATVKLNEGGQEISSGYIIGNNKNGLSRHGAIDALFTAVDIMVNKPEDLHLVLYHPINIGSGSDAAAEVTVILSKIPQFDGKITPFNGMYIGRARHEDTLTASVMAYVNALNKVQIAI